MDREAEATMKRRWWWIRFRTYRAIMWIAMRACPPDLRSVLIALDEADYRRLNEWVSQ